MNRADYLRIANAFREDSNNSETREMVARSMQGTIVENLSVEDQSKVIDMIGAGKPEHGKSYPATRADWKVAIATILIDFILVFPVMLPYFLIDKVRWAVCTSHTIAILLLAGIAMVWARNLHVNNP